MQKLIWASSLLFISTLGFATENLREDLRQSVFNETRASLAEANAASASVLTPETYRAAADHLTKATRAFDQGADLSKVRASLNAATEGFVLALHRANTVKPLVAGAFEARTDALAAEAKTRAENLWEKAELQLYEATSRAEQGKTRRIERYVAKATDLFREAELNSIEQALFGEIEQAIEVARRFDADRWAPLSFNFAVDLLNQARNELSENRYDTDRPRTLATQSLHFANQATYISKIADDIDDNDTNLETVLMNWQAEYDRLAERLDLAIYFDDGPKEATDSIAQAIEDLQRTQANTQLSLRESQSRVEILGEELTHLQNDLEGQEAARNRLNARLQAQAEKEKTLEELEGMFTREEASVVREGSKVVLRMVGLGFASGSAQLDVQHFQLMAKLGDALRLFPDAPVTIEGHTDSHGVDDQNLALSIDRAETVVSYLLANAQLSLLQVSAVGFGEAKPIANNETADGRAKNRRIDVVIYPSGM